MPCPLCQSQEIETCRHQNFPLGLLHCLQCDLIFKGSEWHLSWKEQEARYNQHQNHMGNPGYVEFFEQLLSPLRLFLKPSQRVLDWGSGPGEKPVLAELLKREGVEVDLYDPIYKKDRPHKLYDVMTSTEVLEHFQEPFQSFELIFQHLKEGGIFAGMTQFHEGAESIFQWWYVKDPTHVVFYSKKTFAWIARKWGLEILHLQSPVFVFRARNLRT